VPATDLWGYDVELTWFRKPGTGRPGTLNLCYNALDRHVIGGAATSPALVTGLATIDFATLLERVAALAGALRVLGVQPGVLVRVELEDPADEVLAGLACARLGAVHGDVAAPVVLVTSRDVDEPTARVRLLRGPAPRDPERDVDWAVAVKAGREEPAPCAELRPDAPAYVDGVEVVAAADTVGHPSRFGQLLATLCAGRPIDLR